MSTTPPNRAPNGQPPVTRGRPPLILIGVVVLALILGVIIYASTRNSPNFEEGRADQIDPMPTPEPTSS